MDNELKIYLEQNNLITKRSNYSPIESKDLTDSPELSLDEIREITMGVYKMKQAPGLYIASKTLAFASYFCKMRVKLPY